MYDLRITTIDTDPVDLVKLRLLSTRTHDPAVAILITDTVILIFLRNLEKKSFYQIVILIDSALRHQFCQSLNKYGFLDYSFDTFSTYLQHLNFILQVKRFSQSLSVQISAASTINLQ
jgi:hypothetical protein